MSAGAKRAIWRICGLICLCFVIYWVVSVRAGLASLAQATAAKWPILLQHSWVTVSETGLGFLAALITGVIGAALLSFWPRFATVMWPSILFAQITPKVAIAPLLLVWFGFGLLSKVAIAFLISFFPILANALSGFNSIDPDVRELALSMRAGKLSYLLRFLIPQALPRIFAGARIAATFAVVGAVVGEFVGSDKGLGYLVILAARLLDSDLMILSVVSLALLGLLFYGAVVLAEHLIIPWHTRRKRVQVRELAQSRAAAGGL